MKQKILLLGAGELGKELTISLQRLGQHIVAVDHYPGAPAMQVAQESEVINMLDGQALDRVVEKHQPFLIVPEIEAIRTERFYSYEKEGFTVVPSAKAANFTMNRKAIRDLAARELKLKTAKYAYASTYDDFVNQIKEIGLPCVVKPLMSSSGKGQSIVKKEEDIKSSWEYAMAGSRGDYKEVIIEEYIKFDSEITLLTVTQKKGPTLFCPPIGHRQERGDYQESWQPAKINPEELKEAQEMAKKITEALTGAGIWGVEFFLTSKGVYFSELSPRPHDTGMVTLAQTQNLTEFDLHARAILGLPIPRITLEHAGASAVILGSKEGIPLRYEGLAEALMDSGTDIRIFNKPLSRVHRRMGVMLTYENPEFPIESLVEKAVNLAKKITIKVKPQN